MLKTAILPLALFAFAGTAQTVKDVPLKMTSPVSGEQMFKEYCAVCHGIDGKGGGPAASAMLKTPTDLTLLAHNNGGKFDELKVMLVVKGDTANVGGPHGSQKMPIWGQVFDETVSHGSLGDVQLRLKNLAKYIRTLQAK